MSLTYIALYLLPKNFFSCLMGKLVSLKPPSWLAKFVNRRFASTFKINLGEAEHPIESYPNLQEFFIRKLKPGLRPIASDAAALVSPCDGRLSVNNTIDGDLMLQIKGRHFRLSDLLRDDELAQRFQNGHHATIYLSPKDYHRFHIPVDGEIIRSYHLPGTLWPVNNWAVAHIDQLFCQNERVITIIREKTTGKMLAHIAVGACVVGKIKLAYAESFDQYDKGASDKRTIDHPPISVVKGDELGRFMFGSTIVMLMEPGLMTNFAKDAPQDVKMGEILGNLHHR